VVVAGESKAGGLGWAGGARASTQRGWIATDRCRTARAGPAVGGISALTMRKKTKGPRTRRYSYGPSHGNTGGKTPLCVEHAPHEMAHRTRAGKGVAQWMQHVAVVCMARSGEGRTFALP